MILGIPTHAFLLIHVLISLVAMATGFVVLAGLLARRFLHGWTAAFLILNVLTSLTGFPLPPFGFDPPRAVGILALILLAIAVAALYALRLRGVWGTVFIATAMAAHYLNVFVGVIQSFAKIPALERLAPTQSEPPFVVTQVVVLLLIATLTVVAIRRYRAAAFNAA
jgi:hypothetical protein